MVADEEPRTLPRERGRCQEPGHEEEKAHADQPAHEDDDPEGEFRDGVGGALHVVPVRVDDIRARDVGSDHTDDQDQPKVVHPLVAAPDRALPIVGDPTHGGS
jgi:hypothetical protein